MLGKSHPEAAKRLAQLAQEDIDTRWATLELMAKEYPSSGGNGESGAGGAAPKQTENRQPAAAAQSADND